MNLHNSIFARGYRFWKYCKCRKLCVQALVLSAYYRFCIWVRKPNKLHRYMGIRGEESKEKETEENYRYAYHVAYAVSRVCNRTAWESKCLVRALCAQRLLHKKGIESTLYLGCGKEEGKLVAHAWLRCGEVYVTGGNGAEYATVDKFRK